MIYTGFLAVHAFHMDWASALAWVGLLSGLILAFAAHRQHAYGTLILLFAHMTIEWINYGAYGHSYSGEEIFFLAVHSILDVLFLWQELEVHVSKFRHLIFGGIIMILGVIFIGVYNLDVSAASSITIPDHDAFLGRLLLGGLLGCTLYHLYSHKGKKLKAGI